MDFFKTQRDKYQDISAIMYNSVTLESGHRLSANGGGPVSIE